MHELLRFQGRRAAQCHLILASVSLSTLGFLGAVPLVGTDLVPSATKAQSVKRAIAFLADRMDAYHDRFPVYDDVSSPGGHFVVYTKLPDEHAAVSMNGSWSENPAEGATSIRCVFEDVSGPNFGGFYFLNGLLPDGATVPIPNFGAEADAGIDLSGATALKLRARGELGGERVEIFLGGVGRNPETGQPLGDAPFPDSSPRHPEIGTIFTLTRAWQEITIDVRDLDLSYVLGGFGWVASDALNPGGAIFYFDSIEYVLSPEARERRLQEPRFIASYVTEPKQPDPFDDDASDDIDLVLRNTAFSYDNALVLLAFLAEGSPDSLRRARLLGDAFIYASEHDRKFRDGRIRTAYAAGDLVLPPGWTPGARVATAAIPGFYHEETQKFYEVGQEAIDTGNNAWPMIALLALERVTRDAKYLVAAEKIGQVIQRFRQRSGTYRGFRGGIDDPEGQKIRRPWASAEHNLDVYAAFLALSERTGTLACMKRAEEARKLVDALWDPELGCYRAGTLDPDTLNTVPGQLPVDVQAWSVLALRGAHEPDALQCAESFHLTRHRGFLGVDFNEDRDGVWFEGTGQMATAYAVEGQAAEANRLRRHLRKAQARPPFGDGRGLAAATRNGLTTGFGFQYYRRIHIGATAWNVFGQLGFNPFYQPEAP